MSVQCKPFESSSAHAFKLAKFSKDRIECWVSRSQECKSESVQEFAKFMRSSLPSFQNIVSDVFCFSRSQKCRTKIANRSRVLVLTRSRLPNSQRSCWMLLNVLCFWFSVECLVLWLWYKDTRVQGVSGVYRGVQLCNCAIVQALKCSYVLSIHPYPTHITVSGKANCLLSGGWWICLFELWGFPRKKAILFVESQAFLLKFRKFESSSAFFSFFFLLRNINIRNTIPCKVKKKGTYVGSIETRFEPDSKSKSLEEAYHQVTEAINNPYTSASLLLKVCQSYQIQLRKSLPAYCLKNMTHKKG